MNMSTLVGVGAMLEFSFGSLNLLFVTLWAVPLTSAIYILLNWSGYLSNYLCTYVCMYASIYVRMYVYMHLCMYVCMYVQNVCTYICHQNSDMKQYL